MPKKPLIRDSFLPYHVTGRANNRENFPANIEQVYKILTDELCVQTELRNARVHAFVLMPNHFHMLITTPDSNLDEIMCEFMKTTARKLNSISGRTGHIYGKRYYWSLIQSPEYFYHALKYVYRNPVRAKICNRVQDYRFSSLQDLYGLSTPSLKLWPASDVFLKYVPQDFFEALDWLNIAYKETQTALIKKGLRKSKFEFPKVRNTREVLNWDFR